ncbi:MAG: large conductance mechanosensitive channel protein MscL [Eubacteriales bacterium]|nr:large conductance mechanosensitive channel protein MscL [Eubacteriales bacterium]
MKKFLEEFKKFALRGNVLDMAIGVIVGGAFTGIVTSLTSNFINPLLNLIMTGGAGEISDGVAWTLGAAVASFLTTVVNFIITAFVLFVLLKGINKLVSLGKKKEAPAAPTTKKCPYCLSEIPIAATRCAHCTSELP